MGIDLHLLAEGTASDKLANKRGHTGPPVVPGEEGVCMKEPPMSRGERRMNRRNKIVACVRGNIKTIFKIKSRTREMPVSQQRARKQRGTVRKIFKSRNN